WRRAGGSKIAAGHAGWRVLMTAQLAADQRFTPCPHDALLLSRLLYVKRHGLTAQTGELLAVTNRPLPVVLGKGDQSQIVVGRGVGGFVIHRAPEVVLRREHLIVLV